MTIRLTRIAVPVWLAGVLLGCSPVAAGNAAREAARGGGSGPGDVDTAAPVAAGTAAIDTAADPGHATIVDAVWHMPAGRVEGPAGWRVAGVAIHPINCMLSRFSQRVAAVSADGERALEILPDTDFSFGSAAENQQVRQSGCIVAESPEEFLRQAAHELRPGATMIQPPARVPGADQIVVQMQAADERQAGQQRVSFARQVRADIVGMILHYQHAGKPVEEAVFAKFHCTRSMLPGGAQIGCAVNDLTLVRAPLGSNDALRIVGLVHVRTDPAWEARAREEIDRHVASEQRQMDTRFQADREQLTAIHTNTMDMIRGYGERSKAIARQSDAMHQSNQTFAQHMGDKQTVIDPRTGVGIEVNNQAAHTYKDAGGHVWQTNSAFAPGPDSLWTELVPGR